jgi:DNA replication protein DnaC
MRIDADMVPTPESVNKAGIAALAERAERTPPPGEGKMTGLTSLTKSGLKLDTTSPKDIGITEAKPCLYCGEMRQAKVISEYQGRRFWALEDHDCEQRQAAHAERLKERAQQIQEWLSNPPEARVESVNARVNLPRRSVPGLDRLIVTPENAAAITAAREMLERFKSGKAGKCLYFHGPLGTGKTSILGALAFDFSNRSGKYTAEIEGQDVEALNLGPEPSVKFWPVPDWFAAINRSMDDDREASQAVRSVEKCEYLFLDDIGKQYDTRHKVAELFRVLNHRYNEVRPTCFTSNYSPADLAKKMVSAVGAEYASDVAAMVDRIRETCEVVELRGRSWRQHRPGEVA